MKVNSLFKYNQKYNMEKIEEIVDMMIKEPANRKYSDILFRNNIREYPEVSHEELDLPGIYENMEDTTVFIVGDGALQMDYAASVRPDAKLIDLNALVDVEHIKGPLKDDKVIILFDYALILYNPIQKTMLYNCGNRL